MGFKLGPGRRSAGGAADEAVAPKRVRLPRADFSLVRAATPRDGDAAGIVVELHEPPSAALHEIDRLFVRVFALVGEAIAGATHALLAGDREAAKELVRGDEMVDVLTHRIAVLAQDELVEGDTTRQERQELVAVLRMMPDLERNGDLAEHIARRAARGSARRCPLAAAASWSAWRGGGLDLARDRRYLRGAVGGYGAARGGPRRRA